MTQRLIVQGEAKEPTNTGHWLGAELLYDDEEGFYTARYHARTYDGIKVESSYVTPELRLSAETEGAARKEVAEYWKEFASLYTIE